jgi:hypothetical protein
MRKSCDAKASERSAMSLQTQHDPENEAEITYWNSAGGRRWVERQQSQDIVLGPILQATLERAQLRQGERVVDIGCDSNQQPWTPAPGGDTVWECRYLILEDVGCGQARTSIGLGSVVLTSLSRRLNFR